MRGGAGPLEEVDRLVAEAEDGDDVLRGTVAALVAEDGIVWAGIGFVERGELRLGPTAGTPDEALRVRVPVAFHGDVVGELWVDGAADALLLEQLAARIAPQVLIGWDTGGAAWEP